MNQLGPAALKFKLPRIKIVTHLKRKNFNSKTKFRGTSYIILPLWRFTGYFLPFSTWKGKSGRCLQAILISNFSNVGQPLSSVLDGPQSEKNVSAYFQIPKFPTLRHSFICMTLKTSCILQGRSNRWKNFTWAGFEPSTNHHLSRLVFDSWIEIIKSLANSGPSCCSPYSLRSASLNYRLWPALTTQYLKSIKFLSLLLSSTLRMKNLHEGITIYKHDHHIPIGQL